MKKVDEKVAIEAFTKFLKKFKAKELRRGEISEMDIKEDYIDAIEAIQDGFLTFDDKDHPTLTLRKPLTTGDDETSVKEVTFRSRIRPSDKANIMSGLEVQKDVGKFSLRYAAYITQMSIKELDLLDRDDYDTIPAGLFGFLDGWTLKDTDVLIKTVARYFKWPPKQIDELYLDDYDFFGLVYWYNDAKEQAKESEDYANRLKNKRK